MNSLSEQFSTLPQGESLDTTVNFCEVINLPDEGEMEFSKHLKFTVTYAGETYKILCGMNYASLFGTLDNTNHAYAEKVFATLASGDTPFELDKFQDSVDFPVLEILQQEESKFKREDTPDHLPSLLLRVQDKTSYRPFTLHDILRLQEGNHTNDIEGHLVLREGIKLNTAS